MLKRLILCGCLVLLGTGIAWSADESFVMPQDMQKLLPVDPAFIMAITSVHDLERHWNTIEEMFDEGEGEGTDLIGMLSEQMPQFTDFADLDRPLAVVMGLPNLMGGEEPAFTFIVPVLDFDRSTSEAVLDEEGVTYVKEGDYVAISMDPLFVPASETPHLALELSPGFMTTRLDLEMVVAAYRPLAEMGLGAMGNAPAFVDSTDVDGPNHPARMSPEEVAAMQDLARSVMDSARRFDLAFAIEGEEVTLHTGFGIQPDSPLDPGPQPPFEHALQLTRFLPEGGNIIQTMALDQTRQFEVFRSFYTSSIERAVADMSVEQGEAYRAWVESYLDSMDLFAHPLATSISMFDGGMSANMVMESSEAAADLERFASLFEELSAADIGLKMKKMPTGKVAGVEVRSWTIDYDMEKMAALSADPLNPQLGGTGRMQAEQMIAILRKVTPNINLAARGDYLILSADSNPANLAYMIQQTGQSRGAAHPRTAAVAAKAGPACQQVVTGDLMAVLAWVTEWMEELEDEEFAAIEGNPIPFSAAYTIDGDGYGLDWTMDMPAVKRFAAAVRELEAREARHDEGDGDEEEEAD